MPEYFYADSTPYPRTKPAPQSSLRPLLLLSLFIAGAFVWYWRLGTNTQPVQVTEREVSPSRPPDAEENEAIELFKNVKDSVVNVDTVAFRRDADFNVQAVQSETGSGFVWDERGHVVTNFHVVKDVYLSRGRLVLRVVLADRSEWRGTIIGVAPDFDLAVIRIDAPASKLKKIAVGKSADLQVGQKAYAIGNPFGLSLSMTKGIISALERTIDSPSGKPITGAIQVDAPINPGNSGGPLLNKDGQLIGVNTSIATPSGGNVGIGFAIPVDTVNPVVAELINNGKILKADLGVRLVDQRRLRRAGYTTGVMIAFVEPDSPAAKAKLRPLSIDPQTGDTQLGDLITDWNGEEVTGNADFEKRLSKQKPGDKVKLTIERDEKSIQVEVTLRGV